MIRLFVALVHVCLAQVQQPYIWINEV